MNLGSLGTLLQSVTQYGLLRESLRTPYASSRVQVTSDAVPFVLATLWRELGVPTLVITPRPEGARRLHDHLAAWSDQSDSVLHFPETETLPFERLVSDEETSQQRLSAIARLRDPGAPTPLVVASAAAVAQKTVDRDAFRANSHRLERNQTIELDELLERWVRMGYRFEPAVYGPGFASRRGGILDIFPVGASLPVRIELWGSEIDSIRQFDPATQRSTDLLDSVDVIPARETLPGLTGRDELDRLMANMDTSNCTDASRQRVLDELESLASGLEVEEVSFYAGFFNHGSLLDYFPTDGLLVVFRPTDVQAAAWETEERVHDLRSVKERRGELPLRFPSSHTGWNEVEKQAAQIARRLEVLPWGAEQLVHKDVHILPFTSPPEFFGRLDRFAEDVAELGRTGHRVVALTSHSRRLGEILSENGVAADLETSLGRTPDPGSVTVVQSQGTGAGEGFVLSSDEGKLAVFSDTEIFGVTKQRRTVRRTAARRTAFLSELSPGDHVVHVEHGIGKFLGTGRMPGNDEGTEYLVMQYAKGDKLYVPLEHLDRVGPYVAPMDQPPVLTRLGTQEWQRAKARVARSAREMAAELLSLYASRELMDGFSFSPDTPWQAELEESFPYEETPDQLAAIGEVRTDMESDRPMDRLVCGDVGYGKTEIALRAAFKAVMDGKQVAVLVPTTVLAQQHYVTFSQRFSAYPARVEVLSRFRTDAEQHAVVEGLATGEVDICIGTHRLVQKDVRFKDLGLVVIDEEQRFGVGHKERLKQMRQEVDVLTLTATPIPRTLHISLAGVRDMSTMETPPEERMPIKTYVSEFSDELIREAILRELDRQGQVYFLHNRVHNIDYMGEYIRRMVPEATVGIAHGQMPERQLAQAMVDFAAGKMDVLLCTTIIESGLDLPNVNTLIVNRADAFGLAQLYQLRGRVGRSARRAYAYLLIPKIRSLTETAERRLKAMLAATELGAGFDIAMKDLEIRGAGNILGAQQSGHIHAVGFDLYTRLLANAVEELRARRDSGETTASLVEADADGVVSATAADGREEALPTDLGLSPEVAPTVDLGIPASIPEEYVPDLPMRLGIYHRLVKLDQLDQVGEMEEEMGDRFGPVPFQALNLLYVVRLKMRARRAGIESIARDGERVVMRLKDEVGGARRALQRALGDAVEVGNTQIRLLLDRAGDDWEDTLEEEVEKLAAFSERTSAQVHTAAVG